MFSLGAANLKAFVNAAGHRVEWASGIKQVAYTYDLSIPSGNQTLSGAGFTPTQAIILFGLSDITTGLGFSNGTLQYTMSFPMGAYSNKNLFLTSAVIDFYSAAGKRQTATLTFNADGGVLAWIKLLDPTGTLTFTVIWFR